MNKTVNQKPTSPNATMLRWLAFGGAIMPIIFIAAFTLAGMLRDGYSPVKTAISALGVGRNAWLEDVPAFLLGLSALGLTLSFVRAMLTEMSGRSRRWTAALLALYGLVWVTVSIFTSKPATRPVHTLASLIGEVAITAALFVTASGLKRSTRWHAFASYSRVAGFFTVILVVAALLTSSQKRAGSGSFTGLSERAMVVEVLIWFVALGWGLFRYWREEG